MDKKCVYIVLISILLQTSTCGSWRGVYNHHPFKHEDYEHLKHLPDDAPLWDFPHHNHGSHYNYDSDDFSHEYDKKWREGHWWFPNNDEKFTRPSISSTKPTTASTTPSVLSTLLCIRSCPVTSEYNPVCGSNNVTYNNPGRLECAKKCGVDVTLRRFSPCTMLRTVTSNPLDTNVTSDSASSNTTTALPVNSNNNNTSSTVNSIEDASPTRYTTIDISPPIDDSFGNSDRISSQTSAEQTGNNEPGFTIPYDVLASIFTNPPLSDKSIELGIEPRINEDRYIFS